MNNKNKNPKQKTTLEQPTDENVYIDVNGSYTGAPRDGGQPIQDVDDL